MLGADDLRIDLEPFAVVKLDDDSLLRRLQVVTRCLREEGLTRALSSSDQLRAACGADALVPGAAVPLLWQPSGVSFSAHALYKAL